MQCMEGNQKSMGVISQIKVKVGYRSKPSFWEDKWNWFFLMKQLHPELFTLCQHQMAAVDTLWTGQRWNLFLIRNLRDWEIEKVAKFQDSVSSFSNLTKKKDLLVWQNDTKG